MTRAIVIAGTDTGIGKTIFAAALAGALDASYWKPIQAGLDGETDSEVVRRISGLPPDRILAEAYRLRTPASPHLAAERDGITIDVARLSPPTLRLRGVSRGEGQQEWGDGQHSSSPPPSLGRPGGGEEGGTADVEIPPTTSSCIPPTPNPSPRGGGETQSLVVELAGGLLVPLTRDALQIDVVARWAAPVVLIASTRLGTINHTLLSLEALRTRAVPVLGVAFMGDAAPESEAIIAALAGVRRLGRLPRLDPLDAGSLRAAFHASFRLEDFTP